MIGVSRRASLPQYLPVSVGRRRALRVIDQPWHAITLQDSSIVQKQEEASMTCNDTTGPSITKLAQAKGRLVFDPQSCRTCRVCELVCSIFHEGVASPGLARLNTHFYEFEPENPVSATICHQCEDAPCIAACPADAMIGSQTRGRSSFLTICAWAAWSVEMPVSGGSPSSTPLSTSPSSATSVPAEPGGPVCVEFCPVSGLALCYESEYYGQRGTLE